MKSKCFLFFLPGILFLHSCLEKAEPDAGTHSLNGPYSGIYLNQIAFPMGGLGAGMICLEGTGSLSGFALRNQQEEWPEPYQYAAISVRSMEQGARVLESPVPKRKLSCSPEMGQGHPWALPRYEKAEFEARFPFATVKLVHRDMPLQVSITGWSPFVPGDADESSLPVAALEYTFTNTGSARVEAVFSWHSENLSGLCLAGKHDVTAPAGRILPYPGGMIMQQADPANPGAGVPSFAVFVKDVEAVVDHCWYTGKATDQAIQVWKSVEEARVVEKEAVNGMAPGGSLFVSFALQPGESVTIPLLMAWYVPGPSAADHPRQAAETACAPWYLSKFSSIREVANYWKRNYDMLRTRSNSFSNAFFSTSLPQEVVEAVACNLSVLKSPAILRNTDGRLAYRKERPGQGSKDEYTRSYDQAVASLFPGLARSLTPSLFMNGEALQPGDLVNLYREWRISGDSPWIEGYWPRMATAMDSCIHAWDPGRKGYPSGNRPSPYGTIMTGTDAGCTLLYLAALTACIETGQELNKDIETYRELLEKGIRHLEDSLFNGEYFFQQLPGTEPGVRVPSGHEQVDVNPLIEQRNAPPDDPGFHQPGNGILSDALFGLWLARMAGIDDFLDPALVKSHLRSVIKYNYLESLSNHANPYSPGPALGNEGGLILCSWPAGDAPMHPFPYAPEIWPEVEYELASHLFLEGMRDEGLKLLRSVRSRYDGRYRNPFNGSGYRTWSTRCLSAYGLFQGLTGCRYDAQSQTLYLDARAGDFFQVFLATETGYGLAGLKDGKPFLQVYSGDIPVSHYFVGGKGTTEN